LLYFYTWSLSTVAVNLFSRLFFRIFFFLFLTPWNPLFFPRAVKEQNIWLEIEEKAQYSIAENSSRQARDFKLTK